MLKKMIPFGILFCSSYVIMAQNVSTALIVGMNFSKIHNYSKDHPRMGYNLGISCSHNLGHKWSIGPEMLLSFQNINIGENRNIRIKTSQIQAPILTHFHLNKNISLYAGPQCNLLLHSKIKSKSSDTFFTNELSAISFSLVGGLRYKINHKVNIDGRMIAGLEDMDLYNYFNRKNVNFRSLQISLVYDLH